jgi:hypothetical protein
MSKMVVPIPSFLLLRSWDSVQHLLKQSNGILWKNVVIWDATSFGSCKNRRFGGTCLLHHRDDRNQLATNNVTSNQQRSDEILSFLRNILVWLVTANVVPSSLILVTLMMEAISSSGTSVLTRATRRNIPEDGILHSHRREILKSYIALTGWALWQRRNVFLVRHGLGFYIPEDGILHSHCRETSNLTETLQFFYRG